MEPSFAEEESVARLACDADRPCASCARAATAATGAAATPPEYIYALGKVEARFPGSSLEREFLQCAGRADSAGLSDQAVLHEVLSRRENRYLVREMRWVLRIQGLETYLLHPRDPADFELLVEAIRPTASPMDVDAVIGVRGPIAPPDYCNGLTVPLVSVDQLYSFDAPALIQAIPRPPKTDDERFDAIAQGLFQRVMQIADNAGARDEHRALNYLVMRCPSIYALAAEQAARDFALAGVETRPPSLADVHDVVDVIFSFVHRKNDFPEKFAVRVQTGKYPSLVRKLASYLDR